MDFWGHLVELRERLIKSLLGIFVGTAVSIFYIEPWAFKMALRPMGHRELLYMGIGEAFTTHLTFAFYLGLALAMPIVAYQIWAFVSPGLYAKERSIAVKLSFASTILFLVGAAFAYFVLIPVIVIFFLSFEQTGLRYGGALEPYLSLFAGILIGAGLCFQLPLILMGLLRSGILTLDGLRSQRGYWILAIVIAAAVLTPTGDAVTQLMLAVPMWVLFESAVLYARLRGC